MIGIVFCGYNSEAYVNASLSPFLQRDDCIVSAVSVPFKEYNFQEDLEDETTNILRDYAKKGEIRLVDSPQFILEADARNLALENLPSNIDYYWLVDADEVYTSVQIDNIIAYIETYEAAWYRLCLKNFVFDKQTYMAEPFCPPRIFAAHFNGDFNPRFYWDNDIKYQRLGDNRPIKYTELNNLTVPKEVAWIDHYSWLNDEVGKRKVKYQTDHFGHCSFKWVEDSASLKNKNIAGGVLEFDDDYFGKTGEKKPELIKND